MWPRKKAVPPAFFTTAQLGGCACHGKPRLTVHRRVAPKESRPGSFLCHGIARLALATASPSSRFTTVWARKKPARPAVFATAWPGGCPCHGKPRLMVHRRVAPNGSCPGCFLCNRITRRVRLPQQTQVNGLSPCGPGRTPPGLLPLPQHGPAAAPATASPRLTAYGFVAKRLCCPGDFRCHCVAWRLRLPRQAPVDGLPLRGPEITPPGLLLVSRHIPAIAPATLSPG